MARGKTDRHAADAISARLSPPPAKATMHPPLTKPHRQTTSNGTTHDGSELIRGTVAESLFPPIPHVFEARAAHDKRFPRSVGIDGVDLVISVVERIVNWVKGEDYLCPIR